MVMFELGCGVSTKWSLKAAQGQRMILMIFDCNSSPVRVPVNSWRTNESSPVQSSVGNKLLKGSFDKSAIFRGEEARGELSWQSGKLDWRNEEQWKGFSEIDYGRDSSRFFSKNRSGNPRRWADIAEEQTTSRPRCVIYAIVYDFQPRQVEAADRVLPVVLLYDGKRGKPLRHAKNNSVNWSELKVCSQHDDFQKLDDDAIDGRVDELTNGEFLDSLRIVDKISWNHLNLIYVSSGSEIFLQFVQFSIPFILQYQGNHFSATGVTRSRVFNWRPYFFTQFSNLRSQSRRRTVQIVDRMASCVGFSYLLVLMFTI